MQRLLLTLPRLSRRAPRLLALPARGFTAATQPTHTCAECGCAGAWVLHCTQCATVQPVPPRTNHFHLLGVPVTFDLDAGALEAAFRTLQRAVHPDKHANASPSARAASAAASSALNIAFRVLRSPGSRAAYLLKQEGVDVLEEDSDSSRLVADPALLMEVMEAREELEDVADVLSRQGLPAAAGATAAATASRLLGEARQRVDRCVRDLSSAFSARDFAAAARTTVTLQYFQRILAEAEGVLERREAGKAGGS